MHDRTGAGSVGSLDDFTEPFEAALARDGQADLAAFLPDPGHPLHRAALGELIRIDLEAAWQRGTRRLLDDYRPRFPEVFADPDALRDLAYEEYRLRRQAGESPSPDEYVRRYGFPIGIYPRPGSDPVRPGTR